jgi:hypothetical protein
MGPDDSQYKGKLGRRSVTVNTKADVEGRRNE